MQSTKPFIKELIHDLKSVVSKPTAGFKRILESNKPHHSRLHLTYILLLHTYYIFLPSYLIMVNILAIIFFFILIGLMYYFVQECFISYKESHGHDINDDKYFYTIAYCFALANTPSFILNIINNFLSITIVDNLLVAIFIACAINIPIMLIALAYVLKLMALITLRSNNFQILIELIIRSFITTCQELLGIRAIKDIIVDWREAA